MDVGQWLIDHRVGMDRAEAEWLERLAEFDREGLWARDGQLGCATWLVWRTNMARSTAFEKLRVAHELHRRPIVAEAFREGRLSYSFLDIQYRPGPVEESSAGDSTPGEAPLEEPNRAAKKADAFMDLIRTALAHADGGRAAGDDRYLVHLVSREGGPMSNLDGRPLLPADAARLACDASTVAHCVGEAGEPLRLGRKTREWNTAQRRAIGVRDGGHCRFVGCYFGHYDIHHLRPWEYGGNTDVDNGCCQCPRHHRMLHAGYFVEGDPNGELRFYRPDRSYLGSTYPVAVHLVTLQRRG